MNLKHTLTIASALLIASCTTLQKTEQSTSAPIVAPPTEARAKIILTPEGAAPTRDRAKPVQLKKINTQPKEYIPAVTVTTERKAITFPENQTRDVRVHYDAITGNDLVLSLDELSKEFCYPYKGKTISEYGYRGRSMHTGVDIKAIPKDTIRAAFAGVVRLSKPYSGYGNIIVIRHYNGLETIYSHNAKNLIGVNDVIEAGAPIALAGRTGRATTEHLHFEVRINGQHFNPRKLLDCENMRLKSGTLRIEKRGDKIYTSNGGNAVEAPQNQTLYADITPPSNVSPQNQTTQSKTTESSTKLMVHRVIKGDTLSSIARRYSTTVAVLCKLNNITPTGILSLGQKIKVPPGTRN